MLQSDSWPELHHLKAWLRLEELLLRLLTQLLAGGWILVRFCFILFPFSLFYLEIILDLQNVAKIVHRSPIYLWPIFFYLFIYLLKFWLLWVFTAARGFSLVAANGGYSLLRCAGFSLQWLLLLRSTGFRRMAFSSCGTRAQQLWLVGSRAQAK